MSKRLDEIRGRLAPLERFRLRNPVEDAEEDAWKFIQAEAGGYIEGSVAKVHDERWSELLTLGHADLRWAVAEVERLRALVRRGFDGEDETGRACCPWCHVYLGGDWSAGGHADDCAAMAALGGDDA